MGVFSCGAKVFLRWVVYIAVAADLFVTALGFALYGGWRAPTWWERYIEAPAVAALSLIAIACAVANMFREGSRCVESAGQSIDR